MTAPPSDLLAELIAALLDLHEAVRGWPKPDGPSLVEAQDRAAAVLAAQASAPPFPIIAMGHGKVEVGDAMWEGLPTLWFGNEGQGLGVVRDRHNMAKDGETLVMFTFANLQGLEAIEAACSRVRELIEAQR